MAARSTKVNGKNLDGKKVIQRAHVFAEEVQQSARRLAADVADTTGARVDRMTARAQEVAQELEAATSRVVDEITSAMERAGNTLRRAATDARKRAQGNGFHKPAAKKAAGGRRSASRDRQEGRDPEEGGQDRHAEDGQEDRRGRQPGPPRGRRPGRRGEDGEEGHPEDGRHDPPPGALAACAAGPLTAGATPEDAI